MTREITRHTVQWAVQEPDFYGGPAADQQRARWHASSEGDKGDSDFIELIELAAEHFPPGTLVEIKVPLCPQCGEQFDCSPTPPSFATCTYPDTCDCGFDWASWVADRYS